ncbi:MAG: sugar transferase [Pirellulales bacterium]|nr:sugar transferase [Pirellulales bacterium]
MESWRQFIKRVIDIAVAAAGLFVFCPLLLVIAAVIRIAMGSPAVFRQRRPGLRAKPFILLKFRTMNDARDADGHLLPDGERLTRLGGFLRATSLDELPQLVNVFRGEMSLVGPRPLRMRYLDRFTPEQARRHDVKPGLTGWAQVNGRNAITWDKRLQLDVWYVDHATLALDAYILLLTVWQTISFRGASTESHRIMPEFLGQTPLAEDDCGTKS